MVYAVIIVWTGDSLKSGLILMELLTAFYLQSCYMFTLVTLIYLWSTAGAYAYSIRAWFTGDLPHTLHFAIVKVTKQNVITNSIAIKIRMICVV